MTKHLRSFTRFCRSRPVLTGSAAAALTLLSLFWFALPKRGEDLFDVGYSTVLLDREGALLGATIAPDEQWRFPPRATVPEGFRRALILYEDKRFESHPGVDPVAVIRAMRENFRAGEVVSGASTITMQVIRLSRGRRNRTVREKLVEMVLALRLELSCSKDEILALFASHAPFGGNVVGLDAAAWRYFGREPEALTWAEQAMLAVLPNSPALIHPGRNRVLLREKRDRLLDDLRDAGYLSDEACSLAKEEPIPESPLPLPMAAPHLTLRVADMGLSSSRVRTTLDAAVQKRAAEIVDRHHKALREEGVHNAAALILDTASGEVLAYVGNAGSFTGGTRGNQVDLIRAPRSTGSILKPLLYAAMLESGEILPSQLIPDIPTRYGSFTPENYSRTYEGAVPAYRALARSLNVPAVRMLRSYGVDRFYALLTSLGMTTLFRRADEYGLSLILGGAEGTLWDVTSMYAGMGRILAGGSRERGDGDGAGPGGGRAAEPERSGFSHAHFLLHDRPSGEPDGSERISAGVAWLALQAMVDVARPRGEQGWREFSSSQRIGWKTGTSLGFRDAWAVGVTPRYTIGVWVGNADGEGRPGLVGSRVAAPILFDLFDALERSAWFQKPEEELVRVEVCAKSGYRAGMYCRERTLVEATEAGFRAPTCPYCRRVHLTADLAHQVNSSCEPVAAIRSVDWFVLPPAMEYFYRKRHSGYRPLPPFRDDCIARSAGTGKGALSIIYPHMDSRIYVPLELSRDRGRTVFQAAHRDRDVRVFWHLDDVYMGSTLDFHQMSFDPEPGAHVLTLVDERGESVSVRFTILSRDESVRGVSRRSP